MPEASQQLLSPQHFLQQPDKAVSHFVLQSTHVEFISNNQITEIPFDKTNNLPMLHVYHPSATTTVETHHAGVLVEQNINLTASQKELLWWHFCLCHQGLILFNTCYRLANLDPPLRSKQVSTVNFLDVPPVSIPRQNNAPQPQFTRHLLQQNNML